MVPSRAYGPQRPLYLGPADGPNAPSFARPESIGTAYEHPTHAHVGGSARCRIDKQGWINFRLPVTVSVDVLDEEHFSCEEPSDTSLWAAIEAAVAL